GSKIKAYGFCRRFRKPWRCQRAEPEARLGRLAKLSAKDLILRGKRICPFFENRLGRLSKEVDYGISNRGKNAGGVRAAARCELPSPRILVLRARACARGKGAK